METRVEGGMRVADQSVSLERAPSSMSTLWGVSYGVVGCVYGGRGVPISYCFPERREGGRAGKDVHTAGELVCGFEEVL